MKRTPLKRSAPKKRPGKTLRTKCLDALQKLARLKAADDQGYCECWSCGIVAPWNEMDGGHFIPKGSSSRWALVEENVHPQCRGCNGFGMRFGSAAQQYTIKMQEYYGHDMVQHMIATKGEAVKYYKRDYEEMLADWNAQIRHHLDRIGHG